jgi:hypothetical protein
MQSAEWWMFQFISFKFKPKIKHTYYEGRGSTFLRNIDNDSPQCTASWTRRHNPKGIMSRNLILRYCCKLYSLRSCFNTSRLELWKQSKFWKLLYLCLLLVFYFLPVLSDNITYILLFRSEHFPCFTACRTTVTERKKLIIQRYGWHVILAKWYNDDISN